MSKPSSAYRGLQSCRDMLSNQFTPKYGENFDGYLDAMRDALDWMRWAERKIEHLEALSHAAGQDGEQCRAASVDEDTSWLAQQIEGARDYATGGCVRPDDDDPDEQKWWDDLTRAAQILRALSRGVPEGKCWCLTCDQVTVRMALCPDCGNKRCPKANDHRNACTNSNEPGQPGSAYPAIAAQRKEGV